MRVAHLPLLLGLLGVFLLATAPVASPGGAFSSEETARILARFNHERHARPLDRADLGCPACHNVGGQAEGATADQLSAAFLTPPAASCHWCHNPADGRKPRGPRTCDTCHEGGMRPASHGAAFATDHGDEARMERRTCYDCHARSTCVDCHSRKDTTTYRVHDRTWLAVHGVAVQADPASCGACHAQASCLACHTATGAK